MADHPLRPATDHRLGRPLPHQLPNPTRAPPAAINLSRPSLSRPPAYAVLAEVSLGYPPQQGRFPRATHPCATPLEPKPQSVRLACVRHAASVRSEPGSNSQVHPRPSRLTSTRSDKPQTAPVRADGPNQGPPKRSQNARSFGDPRRRPRIPSLGSQSQSTTPKAPARTRKPKPSAKGALLITPPPNPRQHLFTLKFARAATHPASVPEG